MKTTNSNGGWILWRGVLTTICLVGCVLLSLARGGLMAQEAEPTSAGRVAQAAEETAPATVKKEAEPADKAGPLKADPDDEEDDLGLGKKNKPADPVKLPETAGTYEVHELLILVVDPNKEAANMLDMFGSTMPAGQKSERPPAEKEMLLKSMPAGVIFFHGGNGETTEVLLEAKGSKFISHWPKAKPKNYRLLWQGISLAPEAKVPLTEFEGGHWFDQLRSAGGQYLVAGQAAERFLMYDLQAALAPQVRLEVDGQNFKLLNVGNNVPPLHDVTIFKPQADGGWRLGGVPLIEGTEKKKTEPDTKTPAVPPVPRTGATPAGARAIVAPGAVVRIVKINPAAVQGAVANRAAATKVAADEKALDEADDKAAAADKAAKAAKVGTVAEKAGAEAEAAAKAATDAATKAGAVKKEQAAAGTAEAKKATAAAGEKAVAKVAEKVVEGKVAAEKPAEAAAGEVKITVKANQPAGTQPGGTKPATASGTAKAAETKASGPPSAVVALTPEVRKDAAAAMADWKQRLIQIGFTEAEAGMGVAMLAEQVLEKEHLNVVYRMDDQAFEKLVRLDVTPNPKKTVRVCLVVVKSLDPGLKDKINQLIAQLGDNEWKKRMAAHEALTKLGRSAVPDLKAAQKDAKLLTDAEVMYRVERLLDKATGATRAAMQQLDE